MMVLTLMPRVSLHVVIRFGPFTLKKGSTNHARLISLRKRRLRRITSDTNHLLTSHSTTNRREVLSKDTRASLLTSSMTSVNHATTSRIRCLTRKDTNSLNSLLRTRTRGYTNITNRTFPHNTRSITKSGTPRSLYNNKCRSILRLASSYVNVGNTITQLDLSNTRGNTMIHNSILRVIRRAMIPRIANRIIRSRLISLPLQINNMMTSVKDLWICPQ